MRHLIPRISIGPWGGAALTDDGTFNGDEVKGFTICIQWFRVLIEIGIGGVR